jgi:hypothetical protein
MQIFVLHPDIDVLAALVGRMRDRGLSTVHAAMAAPLVERAAKLRPSVMVLPEHAEDASGEAELAALRNALPDVPEVLVPPLSAYDDAGFAKIVDVVMGAILAAQPEGERAAQHGGGEVRGDLAQIPLPDLLQLLSMGKKTGTLTVSTNAGQGELHLADGEVVDAMYRRAEGLKAVVRLLGERDGAFHFAPDATPGLRRIFAPISTILMEGTRQVDEVKRQREALGLSPTQAVAFQVDDPRPAEQLGATALEVSHALSAARPLDDLLDDLPAADLPILQALVALDQAGVLRRLPIGELRPSLAGPEGMVVLRGLARRLRPRGFRGPGRLVLVGSERSIRLARQALGRLAEAMPGADVGGELTLDRLMEATAQLQLGESIALDVMTVIDRDELGPALPLVVNGAIGVVVLDRPSQALAEILEELEIALVDARSVVDPMEFEEPLDAGEPAAIAAIIRGAIEGMGES